MMAHSCSIICLSTYEWLPELSYVIDVINDHPLKPKGWIFSVNNPESNITIRYGGVDKPSSDWYIPAQGLIFSSQAKQSSTLFAQAYHHQDTTVYSVDDHESVDQALLIGQAFQFDLFETIFFHLSRYEEYYCPSEQKDQWDMMHEQHQFLVRNGLEKTPVVDQLLKVFYEVITKEKVHSPTKYNITHDIDVLRKFENPIRATRAIGRSILDGRSVSKVLSLYKDVLLGKQKDPYDSFDFLYQNTRFSWSRKIAFVMSGGHTRYDGFYDIGDLAFARMLDVAQQAGYEIGLHPSYDSYKSDHIIRLEKQKLDTRLGDVVTINRQHFLKFSFPKTIEILASAGISLDSTLGYQRMIGFRCGTGFPFRLFNIVTRESTDIRELPMIIMDGALLDEANQNLLTARNILDRFLDQNLCNTEITFNIHNTFFDPTKRDVAQTKALFGYL